MSKKHIKFSLPKPEQGVLECLLTIEAEDEVEAVGKLNDYLIELKRNFSVKPLPIGKSDDPAIIGKELLRRLGLISEPTAFIITLHVFVEHWLNQILLRFCPNRDLTTYSFFKKLEIVRSIDKIPETLFLNLRKLNKLRNDVAHAPDYDLTKMDLNYLDCLPDFELSQFKPSYAPDAKGNHIFNVLNCVMSVTYLSLHKHCMKQLGFVSADGPKNKPPDNPET